MGFYRVSRARVIFFSLFFFLLPGFSMRFSVAFLFPPPRARLIWARIAKPGDCFFCLFVCWVVFFCVFLVSRLGKEGRTTGDGGEAASRPRWKVRTKASTIFRGHRRRLIARRRQKCQTRRAAATADVIVIIIIIIIIIGRGKQRKSKSRVGAVVKLGIGRPVNRRYPTRANRWLSEVSNETTPI